MVVHTDLSYLTDDTREAADKFLRILKDHGLNPHVNETWRAQARQDELYYQYVTGQNHKTNTDHSWHTAGRALDISISPVTTDAILFFLDTARACGFSTVANPQKVRDALAKGIEPDLWDWNHVSYHGRYTSASAAISAYNELLSAGPTPAPSPLALIGTLLLLGSVVTMVYHGNSKD